MMLRRLRFAALALAISVAGAACERTPDAATSSARETAVAIIPHTVRFDAEETVITAVGTARAGASAVLYPETGGQVTEVLFKAGDFVEEGQKLIQLEARQETLAVRRAQIAVTEAERVFERYRRLEQRDAAPTSQVDDAQTALESARVELELAQVALAERAVRAPFAGYVGLTDVDPGARITPTTAITQLDDRSVIYVDFEAPEQAFPLINVADAVRLAPFAEDDASHYEATIIGVDNRIDPARRTFTVRTQLDNATDTLRPGMGFEVSFTIDGRRHPAVPEAAIVWGSDGAYVWGVRDGAARRLPVTIVARKQGFVLVRGDVPDGSQVIAEGVQKVRDGARVRPWRTASPPEEILDAPQEDQDEDARRAARAGDGLAGGLE